MTEAENLRIALDGGMPHHTPCYWAGASIAISTVIGNIPAPGQKEGYDWWGVHWTACEEAGGNFSPTANAPTVITDITKWKEQVRFPDIDSIDWEVAAARDAFMVDPEEVSIFFGLVNGIFERFHFLRGFEDALCDMVEEPEAVGELISAIADFYVRIIEKIGKYYKPEYFVLLDDYAHMDGPFMSLDTFDEIIAPNLKKIVDAVEANGMKYIHHCCGREEYFLDRFYELGIRRIDPVQPCNNIQAMMEKYPDMVFIGGLDIQGVIDMPGCTEEDWRAEVRRCIDTYGVNKKGYIIYGATVSLHDHSAYAPGGKMFSIIDEAVKYAYAKA